MTTPNTIIAAGTPVQDARTGRIGITTDSTRHDGRTPVQWAGGNYPVIAHPGDLLPVSIEAIPLTN